jgi:hypothetical protein
VGVPRQSPVIAQVSQTPLQGSLQHTPSTQKLLAHSPALPHMAPGSFFGAEQLPASSHRLLALHTCPTARGTSIQSCSPEPQRPATQRSVSTLAG